MYVLCFPLEKKRERERDHFWSLVQVNLSHQSITIVMDLCSLVNTPLVVLSISINLYESLLAAYNDVSCAQHSKT